MYEASPADFSIENTTDERQTVHLAVTRLPTDTTARPPEAAPHEPRTLSEQPMVFSATDNLLAGGDRAYRCTGIADAPHEYRIEIEIEDGPIGAFDWYQRPGTLYIGIKGSSIEFRP